jgi:N12 class adenine-specific DNA methylase
MDLNAARQKIPELAGLSDESALNVIQAAYYPDMDRGDLAKRLGVTIAPPPVPERSTLRAVGDVGLSLGQGAAGAFKALTDLGGADNTASRGLASMSKFLGEQKSEQSQATLQNSLERIKTAEESGSTWEEAKAYLGMVWDQPAEMIAQGAGSFATLGIGKLAQMAKLARSAKAAGMSRRDFLNSDAAADAIKAASTVGFRTNIGVGTGMGVGAVKGSQFEQTYRNAIQQGMGEEEAQALATQAQEFGGAGTMQQLLGAGLGALASATGPIERMVVGRSGAAEAAGNLARTGKGFAIEALTEGAQGGQERFAGNDAAVDAGVLAPENRMRGVVGQTLQEGLIGGILGGGIGAMRGRGPDAGVDPELTPGADPALPPDALPPFLPPVPPPAGPPPGPMTRALGAGAPFVPPPALTGNDPASLLAGQMGGLEGRPDPLRQMDQPPEDADPLAGLSSPVRATYVDASKDWVAGGKQGDVIRVGDGFQFAPEGSPELAAFKERVRQGTQTPAGAQAAASPLAESPNSFLDGLPSFEPDETGPAPIQPTDILNPKGNPFKTEFAATRAAKKTPGDVVPVAGGFVIRPTQESLLAQDQVPNQAPTAQADPAGDEAAVADAPVQDPALGALSTPNVQVAPKPAAQAETPRVETPAEAGSDAAAPAGVPGARGSGDAQADGVSADTKQIKAAVDAANRIGLTGSERKESILEDLATAFGMTKDEVAEVAEVKAALRKPPSKMAKTTATERFVEGVKKEGIEANQRMQAQADAATPQNTRTPGPVSTPAQPQGTQSEKASTNATNEAQQEASAQEEPVLSGEPADAGLIGRNNVPMAEGGKPFKTRLAAGSARRLQTGMRVKPVKGGFVLRPQTEKEGLATQAAARRLGGAGQRGKPEAAHELLARKGGMSKDTMADLGFDANVRVGARWLFAGNGGMTLGQATEALQQEGFMEGTDDNQMIELIQRSAKFSPKYTPEGYERIAQAEANTRFEDYLTAQQEAAQEESARRDAEDYDPFPLPEGYTEADAAAADFDSASGQEQTAFLAFLNAAKAEGIDTEAITEQAAQQTQDGTDDDFRSTARTLVEAARSERADAAEKAGVEQGREDAQREGVANDGEGDGQPGTPREQGASEPVESARPETAIARRNRLIAEREQREEAAAKQPKVSKAKQSAIDAEQARANYFTPGNIVRASDGSTDEVLSYTPDATGGFSVRVQEVRKAGDQWQPVANTRPRTHSTQPDAKQMRAGPVERGAAPAEAPILVAPSPAGTKAPLEIGAKRVIRQKTVKLPLTKAQQQSPYAEFATGEYLISVQEFEGGPAVSVASIRRANDRGTQSVSVLLAPSEMAESSVFSALRQEAIELFNQSDLLTAPTQADVLAQQERAEQIEKNKAKADRDAIAAATRKGNMSESERREAEILAERQAEKDIEIAPENFVFGEDAPAPIVKKVTASQKSGQKSVFDAPEASDSTPAEPKAKTDKAEMRPFRRADGSIGYEAVPIQSEAAQPTAVSVPPTVDAALTEGVEKQKRRIGRLTREAAADGISLSERAAAQTKVKAAEATLRQMRLTRFDAEDAAVKAVESRDAAAFAAHADLFPDAATAIAALVGPASSQQGGLQTSVAIREMAARAAALSAAKPAAAPSANTIFTEDAAAAARARLKAKLGRLNSGIDPEMMMDGITLAGYHIEKGARSFAAYARAMADDLGDGVKPYLKSWYMGIKYDPRAAGFDGMDSAATVETADLEAMPKSADTGVPENENATRKLDGAGTEPLEGAPTPDVPTPAGRGDAGAGTGESSRIDGDGNAPADNAGRDPRGSLGGDAGAVPAAAGGTTQDAKAPKKPRLPRSPRTPKDDGLLGPTGGLTPEDGANPAPNAPQIAAPQPSSQDFTITDELSLGEGGQKTKFKNNVAAIRLLRDLDATGRMATPDEQAVLARYVGWGGLPQAFDESNTSWTKEFAEITDLMTPRELEAARQSTRYAHFTSREIISDGIYSALRHFGFTGGRTLEAGAGVGNFIGLMPADMRSAGRFTAIEREPFSAAIARHLYPQQSVQLADFTEFKGNDAYFDAAVGNPPFASDPQTDRSGRKHLSGLSLHNYFFAKSVDMLREGGILAQVVTNSFMDAKGDKARQYISDRAELLGAIRLPNSAFSKNAGTEVTTDLIFLRKRPDSEVGGKAARADAKRWLNTGVYADKNGDAVALNQYFIDNPSMMLGDFGAFGTMYGPAQPALVAKPGQDTLAMLKDAVGKLPADVYQSIAQTGTQSAVQAAVVALENPSVREAGYFMQDGKLMQRLPDIAGEARGVEITPATQWTAKTTLGDAGFERIKALAGMRATVRGLIAAEMKNDAAAMTALRTELNTQYDAYRDTHGLINDPSTLRVFDDDPDYPLLASLESGYTPGIGPAAAKRMGIKPAASTAKKGPIFSQRVVAAREAVQKVDTPADALTVSMAERGRLDAAYIGQLLGMEPEAVLRELSTGDKPLLFRDPLTDEFVLRDAYLSGNVRAKLVQAKQAGMFTNINALEAVQPEDVGSHEITARLGSPWVPTEVYEAFGQALFGEGSRTRVFYVGANSSFALDVRGASEVALSNTWGTNKVGGDALLMAVMNNRTIKVASVDEAGKKIGTDVDATEKASIKAQEMREKFNDWLFTDADRSELLTKAYNLTNNNYVTRIYDGSNMTFPGKVPNGVIKFRRHQRDAIARIVQDRTALLDHVVGAGKTFTVVSGAMELKRTGLARKPMVVVPNHLVKQWASDFYRLYPGANVLTATKKDFEKANRRKFLAKIATGDWDAVVIAHSSFGFIQPSPEFEVEFNGREIAKIMAAIKSVQDADGDEKATKRTVKQLEGMKERLENRIRSLRDKPMDDLLDFEQIGVDQLFVDEAHMFKNLMFTTKMQGVAGLNDPSGSQRAYDMFVKTNEVMEKNGRGQGVVFATGTPVSNSLAEMYHMMRYLMPNQMLELGFESFDAWANTYASVEQVWMQAPSGDGFKAQNRMSNFVNTPELLKTFDQVSDTVTMDDIKKAYAEENAGAEFPLPKLKGGRRTPVSLEKSEAQNAYMAEIAARAKAIEQRKGPPQKGDDNILVVMGDARKAAMDIRLVDPEATKREAGGRIDRATDEVVTHYKKYDSVKGTQLVFSDMGTPLKRAKAELKEYEALQARIQAGNEDVAISANLGNEAAVEIMEDAEAAQAELEAFGGDWLSSVKAALRGFSIYDDFKAALIEKGVPEAEIAFIHDFNTDDQKAGLFRKVNAGQIRVLLGSTAKLGAGTNVQERLVALHHLDVPWRPSDVEQREGRIERQGNRLMTEWPNFEIEIQAYVTRDTLDMRMWQVQEAKLKMINQLRTRKIGREIDNAFEDMELSAGEMQAAATGDINLLKEIQLRNDVKKLEQRKRAFDGQRNDLLSRKRRSAESLADLPGKLAEAEKEAEFAAKYQADLVKNRPPFAMNIDGKDYADAGEARDVLRAMDEKREPAYGKDGFPLLKDDGTPATTAAPLSVTINGELIKNRNTMNEMFSDARGDVEPLAWVFNGETYRRRTVAANGIRSRVNDAIADESVQQVGEIGPYAVSVEGSTDRENRPMVEISLSRGGKVVMSNTIVIDESSIAPGRVITNAENLIGSAISEARYLARRLEDAQKTAGDLAKTEDAGEWPGQDKLDAARAAHKAVLELLRQSDLPVATFKNALILTPAEFKAEFGSVNAKFTTGFVVVSEGGGVFKNQPSSKFPTREAAKEWIASQAPGFVASTPDSSTNLRQTGAPEANETDVVFSRATPKASSISQPAVAQIVDAIRARWANAPEIVVVADMNDPAIPKAVRDADAAQRSQGAKGEPEGFFYGGKVYVVASAMQNPSAVVRVLFHESLGHAGLRGVFGDALKPILQQIVALRRTEVAAKAKEYGLDMSKEADRLQAAEEVLAVMAQSKPELGFVKRAIAAIRAFLRKNVPGLADMKLTDADIVQQYILPARAFVERGGAGAARARAPVLSRGATDQTDTPAFRSWFGDSKVVDADGAPLVVYHGTNGDFNTFDAGELGAASGAASAKMGFFFASNPAVASSYADTFNAYKDTLFGRFAQRLTGGLYENLNERMLGKVGKSAIFEGGNVMPLHLSISNPMVVDFGSSRYRDQTYAKVISDAKAAGHDGVILRNTFDEGYIDGGEAQTDVYVAFNPTQIKSATGNNGNFDGTNADIRFSRTSPAGITRALMDVIPSAVSDRLADIGTSQRGFNRWWHRTVGTQFHKAKINAEYGRVYYAVQDFMKDVSRMATIAADQAPDLLPRVDTPSDIKKILPALLSNKQRKADLKSSSDALFDGTLRFTRDEDGNAVEVSANDPEPGGLVWTDAELIARGMNKKSRAMYRQARAAIEQSLDSLMASDVYRMMTSMKPEMYADTLAQSQQMLVDVRKAAATDNSDAAVAMLVDGIAKQERRVKRELQTQRAALTSAQGSEQVLLQSSIKRTAEMLNSIIKAREQIEKKQDRIAELKAAGYAPLSRFGEYTLDVTDGENRVFFGMYESQMASNEAARKFRQEGLTVRQGIKSQKEFQLLKGISPETAMLFADLLGVEQSAAMQVWLKNAVAEQSALKRHIRRKGVAGFDNDASRVVANFLTSNSRAASRALHGLRIQESVEAIQGPGDVKDEAIDLVEYVQNPIEEAQAIRSLLFINYIGGSVSSALVNLTQTVVQTFPYLAQHGGARKSAARVGQAMKMAVGEINDPALAAAVKRAELEGVIKPQEVYQLQAEASRTLGSNLRFRAAISLWGSFFQMAEQYNRRVAFIAGYQTALEQNIANPYAFAESTVEATQGTFNKGNRPDWARGAVGATVFTFKTFTIQYVEFLKRLPPKERALALAVLVMLAGASGLPFAEDVEDVIDTVAQALGYNFTTKIARDRFLVEHLGRDFASFLQYGASGTGMLPFDVGARLGMADLLPGTGLGKAGENKERQVLEVFGVAGSFVRDALKGELRPIAIRNAAKGWEMYDTGIYTDTRGRKVMDASPVDAAFKSIGLQPSGVATESRAVRMQYGARAPFTEAKRNITEQIARGMFEDDKDKIKRAREKLDDWNEKNPEAKIMLNSQAIRRRVVEMRKDRKERFLKSTPKELRASTREAIQ